MKQHYLLTLLFFAFFLCTCAPSPKEAATEKAGAPNVLFIAVDDLRPELASFGKGMIHSPNIDRLAAMGTAFTNAYCNVPVCGASRASIMTGLRPLRSRFWGSEAMISEDAPDAVTLHGHFKANGYYTAAMGKILHHASDRAEDYNEPNWKPGVGGGAGRDYQMPENIAIASGKNFDGRGPAFERGAVADTAYRDGKIADRAVDFLAQTQVQLQGKSLAPLLEDPAQDWSDAVFTRWKEADNITTTRYSYTEWYDDEGDRFARTLFDHDTDSLEVINLAEQAASLPVVEELAARLPIGATACGHKES
jgi:hypothetical protein